MIAYVSKCKQQWCSIILINVWTYFHRSSQGIELPEFGKYATGIIYLDKNTHVDAEKEFDALAASLGIKIITWRTVPTDVNAIGIVARKSEPLSRQVFVTADLDEEALKKQVKFIVVQQVWTKASTNDGLF